MNKEMFNGDELAINVWQSKYATSDEDHYDDMHRRMAKEFARIEEKYQNGFIDENGAEVESEYYHNHLYRDYLSKYGIERDNLTEERIYELFKDFKWIVPQGSIMYGLGRKGVYVSLSNCYFVGGPEDSYGSILEKDEQLVQLMKRRAGVGIDISKLRPRGVSVSNSAGSSTGAASFMERYSDTTREVGQQNRRGALLISIDINHPDVKEFATKKSDSTKVTGANVSIKMRDDFMDAVENDEDYILKFPCDTDLSKCHISKNDVNYNKLEQCTNKYGDKVYVKKVKAKELWETITQQARDNSEPGILFWDNVIDNGPDGVYDEFRPEGVNPCGEITLQPMDSCRLMLINLFSFVNNPFTDEAEIDLDKVYEISYENQRLMDDLIDLEIEHIDEIINKIKSEDIEKHSSDKELKMWKKIKKVAKRGRRTGSGITGLGDMLAALGVKYDSQEGLDITEEVMKTKMKAESDCTVDLSIQRGSFPGWDKNKEFVSKMDSHGAPVSGKNDFYDSLLEEFPGVANRMFKYGRRNVSFSTIAPAGSVSILTQTTSGCEPLFQPYYMRRKKINHDEDNVKVDFVDDSGDKWREFAVIHPKFKDWINEFGLKYYKDSEISKLPKDLSKDTLKTMYKNSPWFKSTAEEINWVKRVEMQSILQSYTSHSISSTLNLPEEVSRDEVEEIYFEGWKRGLKGVTVYRKNSRSGVLVDEEEVIVENRPKTLDCDIYHNQSGGDKFTTIIGLIDNKPYELFCIPGYVASNYDKGTMTKVESGQYRLDTAPDESYGVFQDVTNKMPGNIKNLCIAWSYCLRYGTPIEKLVDKIGLVEEPINAFPKVIQRNLKLYIDDGAESTQSCPECNENSLIYQEGCKQCTNPECGWSAC